MIEVGMMVEIIHSTNCSSSTLEGLARYIGHIGRVIGEYPACEFRPQSGIRYEIEGANPEERAFAAKFLRPIPPKESKDISETRANPITFDDCAWQPEEGETV